MRYINISFIYYLCILFSISFNVSYTKQGANISQETNISNIKIKCACNKNNKTNNSNNILNNMQKQTILRNSTVSNVTVLPRRNGSLSNSNVLHSRKSIKWMKVKIKNSISHINLHPKSNKMPDISNRKLKSI